jgi:hypothetical protein
MTKFDLQVLAAGATLVVTKCPSGVAKGIKKPRRTTKALASRINAIVNAYASVA